MILNSCIGKLINFLLFIVLSFIYPKISEFNKVANFFFGLSSICEIHNLGYKIIMWTFIFVVMFMLTKIYGAHWMLICVQSSFSSKNPVLHLFGSNLYFQHGPCEIFQHFLYLSDASS